MRYSTACAAYGKEVPADTCFFDEEVAILKLLTTGYVLPVIPLDINQKSRVLWQSAWHTGKYGTSIVLYGF